MNPIHYNVDDYYLSLLFLL